MNYLRKLEVCVDSIESAVMAWKARAFRVELCSSLVEGGITPSYALIKYIRELEIQLNVLIRPRGGDFLYTDYEFNSMKEDIRICGEFGCNGVVIGILNADGTIDKKRNKELVDLAKTYSMSVTFHRAIDRANDLFQALEDIIELKCDRILTSGGCNSAIEGSEIICKMIKQADNRIIIMPGAGITPENVEELLLQTNFQEVHGTFRSSYISRMKYQNTKLGDQKEEYTYQRADYDKIMNVLSSINNH